MPVPRHLEEAAQRLEDAERRLRSSRAIPAEARCDDDVFRWLEALTDFALALADVQRFEDAATHEKLQDLATGARAKAEPLRGTRAHF